MERNKQSLRPPPGQRQVEGLNNGGGNDDGMFLKVMTDEQMEVLRKQIAAYATICKQLEKFHRSLSHNNDYVAGLRPGHPYSTSLMASAGHKLGRRHRWYPTAEQLRILERVFYQEGIKTPNGDKVKEITAELAQHGQISEPNVYNWFQNRRARLKKKQMLVAEANNTESESEIGFEYADAKDKTPQKLLCHQHVSQGCLEPAGCSGQTPMEESHNPFLQAENSYLTGNTWWPNIS